MDTLVAGAGPPTPPATVEMTARAPAAGRVPAFAPAAPNTPAAGPSSITAAGCTAHTALPTLTSAFLSSAGR